MITLKEIAKMANVSSATVSKVINGKDKYISDATRKKILDIVEKEGYITNGIAKSLKMKNTKTIGIIIPDVMNLFFSELARGIEDAAEKKGYTVILCNSENKVSKTKKYIEILQEKMVDGIILTPPEKCDFNSIRPGRTPTILLDRDVDVETNEPSKIGRIFVNNTAGSYKATSHLLSKGCKEIAIISSDTQNKPSLERIQGYENALRDKGYVVNSDRKYLESYNIETGYNGVKSLLMDKRIDGLFCGNDLIAIGALKALRELNLSVPSDVKIVGFDDILLSRYLDPPLTTIKQPVYVMGEKAIEMLIALINDEQIDDLIILETLLIERDST